MARHKFTTIRIRASQSGRIMTEPRSKSEELSETAKTYLRELYISIVYGRHKDIINKYVIKGNMVEEEGITLLSRYRGEYLQKNSEILMNDFISGTPDIFTGPAILQAETITDIKCSWDIFSFFKSKTEKLDQGYYWQLQSYMDLTGAGVAYLCYCLVNTPPPLIESEKRKLLWMTNITGDELRQEALAVIEKNCTFDDIPINERINLIEVPRNQEDIDRLHDRVLLCRKWMNENFE